MVILQNEPLFGRRVLSETKMPLFQISKQLEHYRKGQILKTCGHQSSGQLNHPFKINIIEIFGVFIDLKITLRKSTTFQILKSLFNFSKNEMGYSRADHFPQILRSIQIPQAFPNSPH